MKRVQDVVLGGLIVLLVAGLIHWLAKPDRGAPLQLEPPPTPGPITIYIVGEVKQPGIYSIPVNSRLDSAVSAAGGLTENADLTAVNLADKLRDSQKVIIPAVGDIQLQSGDVSKSHTVSADLPLIIDLNSANQEDFEKLPGIGPEKASQILRYRDENGPFKTIEEIQKVPGIGLQIFKQIEPYLIID